MHKVKDTTIPKTIAHNAFLLRNAGVNYLGYRRKLHDDSCYSILEPDMLLGEIVNITVSETKIIVSLTKPMMKLDSSLSWQKYIFSHFDDANINFPWPPLGEDGQEAICPNEFWDKSVSNPESLNKEEKHFRSYSVKILKEIIFDGCRIYDPACSTGKFLSSIKDSYPQCDYYASDLSPQMVSLARQKLPNAFVHDVIKGNETHNALYDVVFCRFLNHEVILTTQAEGILLKLLSFLSPKGHLIIFGHTPISCDIENFSVRYNMQIKRKIGYSDNPLGIFQYYILQSRF